MVAPAPADAAPPPTIAPAPAAPAPKEAAAPPSSKDDKPEHKKGGEAGPHPDKDRKKTPGHEHPRGPEEPPTRPAPPPRPGPNNPLRRPPPDSAPLPPVPKLQRRVLNMAGLPIFIYGMADLTPPANDTSRPIHVNIHLNGRLHSANDEDPLVRVLYGNIRAHMVADRARTQKDLLMISFDARDHGKRTTNRKKQDGWCCGNPTFGLDQYAMILGGAQDVSLIIDLLPPYLFPMGDRHIASWSVSGRSLGGHTAWHVLADEPRVKTAAVLIGMPDYTKLLKGRANETHKPYAPPYVPHSLLQLINRTDPSKKPYDSHNPRHNPFWGKHIFTASGAIDPLVNFNYSREFLRHLVLGPRKSKLARESLEVFVQPHTEHQATNEMLELASRWIYRWSIGKGTADVEPPPKLPTPTFARPHRMRESLTHTKLPTTI
ncbi:hypothetical protein MSPP1_001963 [Malassezia sp. CBS 17886]|nr:hypothetical protein MSPP1_001963 [Malassezia sp. CBS 17886]